VFWKFVAAGYHESLCSILSVHEKENINMTNEYILKIILFGLMIFFLGIIPLSLTMFHFDYQEKKKKINFWGVVKILATAFALIFFYNIFHPIFGTYRNW